MDMAQAALAALCGLSCKKSCGVMYRVARSVHLLPGKIGGSQTEIRGNCSRDFQSGRKILIWEEIIGGYRLWCCEAAVGVYPDQSEGPLPLECIFGAFRPEKTCKNAGTSHPLRGIRGKLKKHPKTYVPSLQL